MGSISCFEGSKKSIEGSINVVFVISVPKKVVDFPKRKPQLYRECINDEEDLLALIGGLLDGDGSVSV